MGKRTAQHKAVINAARPARVELIAYTGILHGEKSPINLGKGHHETERLLKASGVRRILLRGDDRDARRREAHLRRQR